jgi:small GTP-binding protein
MELEKIRDLITKAKESNAITLDLSSKGLTSLPLEIVKLKNLTQLDISGNQLTSLPSEIKELKNLTEFYISNNQLTSLPPEIKELKKLTTLYMSNNQLTSLPPEIGKLKKLTTLYIFSNQLTSLPPEIGKLKKLTTLDISSNQLTSLPLEITELKNLTKLTFAFNKLTSLPPEISKLKNLTTFYLTGNLITSFPSEITKLKNLTKLSLASNKLTSLSAEISKLKNLTTFRISLNQLTSLPSEIAELKNLTELSISNNQLTLLPPEITELKNLTTLDISSNQLTSLPPEMTELKNLTTLNMSSNQLTSLPPEIGEIKKLTTLAISYNQLTSLPPEIGKLKNLTTLNISSNQLTSLPPEILELGLDIKWEYQLGKKEIILGGNPLKNPPVEIVKKGREAILNYFKSLEDGKQLLNEVKVLLVGDGGAGKTSLAKRIFGEEINGNESQTQGINIRKLVVENGDREIKANLWDFGGQEIMHATHQFFLSKRSLYILVLDGRKDEKPEYWLKIIENFGGESPILVVINKIDENPAFELNRKFLKEKYPSIKGFYRLSCMSNEGIEEFLKTLKEELTKVKNLETEWPKSWFNVKNRLEKICPSCPSIKVNGNCEHCNFIEYKEYETICDEEGIKSGSSQNTLVDFLHDLGVILHFRDIPLLNTYVLEPQWVTNAVYRIINSKEIVDSRGILKPNDMLPNILKQDTENKFYYPPHQYGFILNLMKKFELSYDLDDRAVLLPNLLEIQEPNFEFDYEGALKFVIDYDFLPPSVMPRFIVKMNRDIKDKIRWRTGVVLEDKGFKSNAVIKADNEAKRISIYVDGDQKRDYFAVILQKFREINNSFEKLKATEKIPLPDEPEVTVGYEHLIKLELRGIETYMPDGSDNEYKVSELLGTVINGNGLMEILEILQKTEMNEYKVSELLGTVINGNGLMEILEILQKTEMNEKEILKILQNIQKIESESNVEESRLEKINRSITLNPNICGVGPNINEMIKLYLERKKRRS